MNNRNILIFSLTIAVVISLISIGLLFVFSPLGDESRISRLLKNNGYTEFKPPSKLVPPGTWVSVINESPLHLGIICTLDSSLGLKEEALSVSDSADVALLNELSGSFNASAQLLESLQFGEESQGLKKLSLTLSNVRILEIADEAVLRGLPNRSDACRRAIELRLNSKEPISMVKSALVADVTYTAEFHNQIQAETKAKIENRLALKLDAKLDLKQDNETSLKGSNLIWGIRDDAVLAKAGFGLPPTGGTDDSNGILQGKGPATAVSTEFQSRRSFEPSIRSVKHDVVPLRQNSTMDCWATVFTMLRSWQANATLSVPATIAALGDEYVNYYVRNNGLPGGLELDFVEAAGLQAKAPASYSLTAYLSFLEEHGPLWIIVGDGINSHARLLVGIYGPSFSEDRASYDAAVFEFIDPLTGSYQYQPALTFMDEFESEASWILQTNQNGQELRWQILHL